MDPIALNEATVTLVSGYSGIVGAGIVSALLSQTRTTVVAVVRLPDGDQQEQERGAPHERLLIVPGIAADGSMDGLPDAIGRAIGGRKISHVVSCFGGRAPGKLLSSMDDGDVLASATRSLPHLRLLKAVTPLVDVGGENHPTWVFITGMLGERCFLPEKLTGMTLSNSLLYGMIVAFRAELSQAVGNAIRVLELRIGSMLHKPQGPGDDQRVGSGHPAMPASTKMKSFSSELVGRLLVDSIEKAGKRGAPGSAADVVRLTDAEFERAQQVYDMQCKR